VLIRPDDRIGFRIKRQAQTVQCIYVRTFPYCKLYAKQKKYAPAGKNSTTDHSNHIDILDGNVQRRTFL
jgi:hypothetical protein